MREGKKGKGRKIGRGFRLNQLRHLDLSRLRDSKLPPAKSLLNQPRKALLLAVYLLSSAYSVHYIFTRHDNCDSAASQSLHYRIADSDMVQRNYPVIPLR